MLRSLFIAVAILGLSACASGADLPHRNLAHLKRQATDTFDLELGPFRLGLVTWLMGKSDDPDAAALRNTLKACTSVHVRHYEFAADAEYPQVDIEAIQSRLSGRGWSSLVTVRDRKARENVDVYIRLGDEKVTGFVVLASEPRELTIVDVAGSLRLDDIERLRTHFGAHAHAHAWAMADEASPRS